MWHALQMFPVPELEGKPNGIIQLYLIPAISIFPLDDNTGCAGECSRCKAKGESYKKCSFEINLAHSKKNKAGGKRLATDEICAVKFCPPKGKSRGKVKVA